MNSKPNMCVRAAIMLLMMFTGFSAWANSPAVEIPYLDGNGDTQYCTDFTVLDNTKDLQKCRSFLSFPITLSCPEKR